MADETIVTRYIVEGDEALEDSIRLRQITEEVKKELIAAKQEGKSSFADIAAAMKLAVQAGVEYRKEVDAIKASFQEFKKTTIDPKAISAAQEEMKEQIAEVRKEWRMTVEATRTAIREIVTAEKQAAKEIEQTEKGKAKLRNDAMREYVRITRQGYGVMSQAAKTYGMEIDQIKQKIVAVAKAQGVSFNEAAQSLKGFNVQDINVALGELNSQVKTTDEGLKIFGRTIKGVGDIANLVFGTILGVGAIQVLQRVVQWITQSTQGAIEFSQSVFRLEVSTRALRRAGIDVTFKSAAKQAEELGKKFGVFTQKELIGGISNIQLLTRNFGFTEKQMGQVAEASATLAVLLGDDLNEAARKMALFMSSGYAESMQRAGLAVNRRVVEEKAHALGIRKSYLELTEQERAYAALQVILEQVNPLTEDAVDFQDTLAGKIRAANAEIQNQQDILGTKLLPFNILWKKALVALVSVFSDVISGLERFSISLWKGVIKPIAAATLVFGRWKEGIIKDMDDIQKAITDAFNIVDEELEKAMIFDKFRLEDLKVFDDKEPLGDTGNAEKQAEQVKQIFMDMVDEIDKAMEDLKSRQDALARDLARDMERMSRDNTRNIQDIWSKFFRRMEDIQTRYQQRIADAQSKYERQVEDEQRKFALRREQIQEKQRERLLKIERDYQERLRRLREDFLFSLEDAIRERDAREVLQLVRRFKLEKDRAKRERDNRMKELKEQGTAEMRELARQQAERMAQLKRELEERIRSIALARAREREDAKLARERALADEAEDYRIRKEEREIRHKEQMAEAEARYNERLEKLAKALSEEYDITEEMAGKIRDLLMKEYGPGGTAEQMYGYLIGIIQTATAAIAESIARISQAYRSIPTVKYTGAPGLEGTTTPVVKYTGDTSFQEGGTLVATKPTMAMFGEVPEVVTFTPINRIGTNEGKVFGGTLPASARRDGKIRLEILLSSGLEANIIDNTLSQAAVIVEKAMGLR